MSKKNHTNTQQANVSSKSTVSIDPQRPYEASYHDIEELAYRIHEEKGGTELENWLEAERMLKEKHS